MVPVYEYIGQQFVGHTYHFKCDCLLSLDVIGEVVDWSVINNELLLHVQVDKKIAKIGLNHPNLTIEKKS